MEKPIFNTLYRNKKALLDDLRKWGAENPENKKKLKRIVINVYGRNCYQATLNLDPVFTETRLNAYREVYR